MKIFRRGSASNRAAKNKASGHQEQAAPQPELASQLQTQADQWRALAARQQEAALQLQQIATWQHEMARSWEAAGDPALEDQARRLEESVRELTKDVLDLEARALEKVQQVVAEAGTALHPH